MHRNEHTHPRVTERKHALSSSVDAIREEDNLNSACDHDCTGLTPTPARNEYEAEAYQALFHYVPPYQATCSVSALDDPIPPFNPKPVTDSKALKSSHDDTNHSIKCRHDYP